MVTLGNINSKSNKFVPPKDESKAFPRYASYAAGTLKTHGAISGAKNSLNNRMWMSIIDPDEPKIECYGRLDDNYKTVTSHAFLLENVSGEYFTLYEILPGLTKEELPWTKEYYRDRFGYVSLVTDYHRNSEYYQKLFAKGDYQVFRKAAPMTTDEYVAWRVAVELEIRGVV